MYVLNVIRRRKDTNPDMKEVFLLEAVEVILNFIQIQYYKT